MKHVSGRRWPPAVTIEAGPVGLDVGWFGGERPKVGVYAEYQGTGDGFPTNAVFLTVQAVKASVILRIGY